MLVTFIINYDGSFEHLSIGALLFMSTPMHMYLTCEPVKNVYKNLRPPTSTNNLHYKQEGINVFGSFCKNLHYNVFSL